MSVNFRQTSNSVVCELKSDIKFSVCKYVRHPSGVSRTVHQSVSIRYINLCPGLCQPPPISCTMASIPLSIPYESTIFWNICGASLTTFSWSASSTGIQWKIILKNHTYNISSITNKSGLYLYMYVYLYGTYNIRSVTKRRRLYLYMFYVVK